jgi:TetR/AcrR family transcriptional repressor of nem operon
MSGKLTQRELAKQETREALIQAGMAAFTEEGVDLPSLDAICARAGFTRGAFYVHFKDRDAFFAAVAEHALRELINWVISTGEGQGGLASVVERFLSAFSAFQEGRKLIDMQKLLMQIVARGAQRGKKLDAPYRVLLRSAVERMTQVARIGQAQGVVKTDLEPAQLGLLMVTSAVGFVILVNAGLDYDLDKARALCSRWLFSNAASSSKQRP